MTRQRPTILAAMVLALAFAALAGCLADGVPPEGGAVPVTVEPVARYKTPAIPDFDFTTAIDIVHDHANRDLHGGHFGLELVGFSGLMDGMNPAYAGGFIEVDVKGDLVAVASLTGTRAYTLVDISDRANPQVLHQFYSSNDNWDVRLSDDTNYVFISCQGSGLYTFSPVGQCTDYDGIPTVGDGSQDGGIVTVDIRDRANPVALCYTQTQSVHNLYTATLDDGTVVVANDSVEILVMEEDGCLRKVAEVPGRHDVHIQKHPITGDWLLYTGTNGLTIHNINDPANPEEIGIMAQDEPPGTTAWHEQSPANHLIRGKHLTLGAGERSTGAPGPVTVFDTTDPFTPQALSQWILPVPPALGDEATYNQAGYMFSEHNIDVSPQGQVCVGHYHAGVWVFDVSTEERMREPVTLGYYQPNRLNPDALVMSHPAGGLWLGSPYVWGCMFTDDGHHLVVPDANSGLYILEVQYLEPLAVPG